MQTHGSFLKASNNIIFMLLLKLAQKCMVCQFMGFYHRERCFKISTSIHSVLSSDIISPFRSQLEVREEIN